MTELETRLGYRFRDRSLLETALTHSSYANENRAAGAVSNERLEFLGDSVLGVTVADHLYRSYPDMPEGKMTRLRAELVCEQSLHRVARELELGRCLRLGKGEEHNGGRERASILADAVEAVIAALYLDGGMEPDRPLGVAEDAEQGREQQRKAAQAHRQDTGLFRAPDGIAEQQHERKPPAEQCVFVQLQRREHDQREQHVKDPEAGPGFFPFHGDTSQLLFCLHAPGKRLSAKKRLSRTAFL